MNLLKLSFLSVIIINLVRGEPPAVREHVDENFMPEKILMDIVQFPKHMNTYLTRFRRHNTEDFSHITDSYIQAYKLSHEQYQKQLEDDSSRISLENQEIILSRTRRDADAAPPHEKDFLKFELTDAIHPDSDTLKHRKVANGKNLRLPFEIADLVVFGNKTAEVSKPSSATTTTEASPEKRKRRRRVRKTSSSGGGSNKTVTKRFIDDNDDLMLSESRSIKIISPAPLKTPNGELPVAIQKAIGILMSQKNQKPRTVKIVRSKSAYKGERQKHQNQHQQHQVQQQQLQQQEDAKASVKHTVAREVDDDDWQPMNEVSLGRYPAVNAESAPDYLTFVPVKGYKAVSFGKPPAPKTTTTTPAPPAHPSPIITTSFVPVPQIQYIIKEVPVPVLQEQPKYAPNYKFQYSYNPEPQFGGKLLADYYPSYETQTKPSVQEAPQSYQKLVTPTTSTKMVVTHEEPQPSPPPQPPKQIDYKLEALTSLIGKDPSVQLKGLNDILEYDKKALRPEDSKSPILFHPNGVNAPEPLTKLNIKVLDLPETEKKVSPPEPISLEEFHKLYGGDKGVKLSSEDYSDPKPFTPIDEPEYEYKYISTPTSTTTTTKAPPQVYYKPTSVQQHHDHGHGLTKGYLEDGSDLHYAAGYEFGYRVRDYHTGNDFGHTQNKNTDGKITGEYHILLPDGRVQNVRYRADDDGFHADVTYENP